MVRASKPALQTKKAVSKKIAYYRRLSTDMDEVIELVLTVIGLAIYWWFTSSASKKAKKMKVNPPEQGKQVAPTAGYEPDYEEEDEPMPAQPVRPAAAQPSPTSVPSRPTVAKPKPVSFKDLLEQYVEQMQRVEEARRKPMPENTAPDTFRFPSEAEPAAKPAPKKPTYRTLEEEAMLQKEEAKSLLGASQPRSRFLRGTPMSKLFSSPEDIRKAFIMKEIFDRKHFDI